MEERDLSPAELAVIDVLLSDGRPGSAETATMLGRTRVIARCGCGCDTVLLEHPDRVEDEGDRPLAEATDRHGLHVHLLVGNESGTPSRLEVYGYDGARFPDPADLRLLPPD